MDAAGRGFYQAAGPAGQTQVYTGHAQRFEEATKGGIRVTSPDFAALTITPLGTGATILITACGRCENADMQFSADRRTVGRNWGHAPVRIEAVRGSLLVPEGQWTCHALAPDGTPKQQVPISYENGRGHAHSLTRIRHDVVFAPKVAGTRVFLIFRKYATIRRRLK